MSDYTKKQATIANDHFDGRFLAMYCALKALMV